MKRRQWSSKEKLQIVLEGLSGKTKVSKLSTKYQISQTQYYRCREQMLKFAQWAFETKNITKKKNV